MVSKIIHIQKRTYIKMKKNYYQTSVNTGDGHHIHVNFMNMGFLVLTEELHRLYEDTPDMNSLREKNQRLYDMLAANGFIIEDGINELEQIRYIKETEKYDQSLYHLIVNPTLDCNLSCWYCYEKKVKGSYMPNHVVEAVKKNIELHDREKPFSTLKLSFFGGEPFMKSDVIRELSSHADTYCRSRGKKLILDFTTNGSLIKASDLSVLASNRCMFQITLDGDREQHNKIKFVHGRTLDTFQATCNNIHAILDTIPDSYVFVRINFDRRTLDNFDEILGQIEDLDRKRVTVILKKVWQVNAEEIDKEQLIGIIQRLLDDGFVVDYYTQGKLCFGERDNEAVVNYDGNVFKCTTIDDFCKENAFGAIDMESGRIDWDMSKLPIVAYDLTRDRCRKCRLYPSCYGPCTLHLMAGDDSCYLNEINLTLSEYVMFMYKNELNRIKAYK